MAELGGGLGGTSGVSKRTDRKCTLVLEDGSGTKKQIMKSPIYSGLALACMVNTHGTAFSEQISPGIYLYVYVYIYICVCVYIYTHTCI